MVGPRGVACDGARGTEKGDDRLAAGLPGAGRRLHVTSFAAEEAYGTWVDVPGVGRYSHTSDVIAPAGVDLGASLAKAGVVPWPECRGRRLAPLERGGGRLIWQFGENEELTR